MTPNLSVQALTLPSTGVISCQSQIGLSLPLPPIQQPVVLLVTCQCIGGSSVEVGASYQPQQTQQWAPVCTAARKRPGLGRTMSRCWGGGVERGSLDKQPVLSWPGSVHRTQHRLDRAEHTHTSQGIVKPIAYPVHKCVHVTVSDERLPILTIVSPIYSNFPAPWF